MTQFLTQPFVEKLRQRYGVLVVDDDDAILETLDFSLQQSGFAVWLAPDGPAALELYRRHADAIDVLLIDVRMPGQDGPAILSAIQELSPSVACCFMSGDMGDYTVEHLHWMGAAAVFDKPFQMALLTGALQALAMHHRRAGNNT